ncbi:hypothetical protein GCM10007860_09450 [Chitiniphilus shinanonensis]|uniref:Uncharacterized protein n=1 Tax=Chitiniphilus shinanonensis TaxID=553088 RepID=A0ABQ6BRF1_9NEIS|nr:hypothetical protein GCM10007860_09450 [Chitiniphilus shinanonensis]
MYMAWSVFEIKSLCPAMPLRQLSGLCMPDGSRRLKEGINVASSEGTSVGPGFVEGAICWASVGSMLLSFQLALSLTIGLRCTSFVEKDS